MNTEPQGFADRSVAIIGSVTCLVVYSVLTVIYLLWNLVTPWVFDAFPFQLYTAIVSVAAILMAILILIAESRSAVTDRATQKHISDTADNLAVMQREQTEILRAELQELRELRQIESAVSDAVQTAKDTNAGH